jgi:hypothetical protein
MTYIIINAVDIYTPKTVRMVLMIKNMISDGAGCGKRLSAETTSAGKPKRLSKAGEWLRDHPKGLGITIYDMRAVLK